MREPIYGQDNAAIVRAILGTVDQGPPPTSQGFFSRVGQAARAILGPPADEGTAAIRLEICRSCDANADGYCRDCGCGRWALARLDRKVKMSLATCPRGLWPT